jgi:hypothetical protein
MSGSEFWEGPDWEEPEFPGDSGQTGGIGSSPNHQNGTCSPDSADPADYYQFWNELEQEYYKDFDRLVAAQDSHQCKYKGKRPDKKRTKRILHSEEYEPPVDNTGGNPYREEKMEITDLRRGGQRRRANISANSLSKSFSGGGKTPPYSMSVDCPECNEQVCFGQCLRCEKFQVWDEKDEGLKRCHHEYLDLESRGYYDGSWDDHPENFDPETFERIQEQKQRNEEFYRNMESEREELERMAEELERREEETERKADSEYDEYLKDEYGEFEEEEEKADNDEDEGDYDQEEVEKEEEEDDDENGVEDDYGEEDEEEEGDEDEYGEDDDYDYE